MPRVLIANRGEIALRILRSCRTLGIEVVAAYTRCDAAQRHLVLADDTVCIGERSYLDIPALVSAATTRGCDAVHPGYGLLAENADFARAVRSAGLIFVGPSADTIATMGNKSAAREAAAALGLPVLPGCRIDQISDIPELGTSVGYPLLVKASYGGGGRGMRLARTPAELVTAVEEAGSESLAAFGHGDVYLEKLIENPRHIEVQVFGDGRGKAVQFGTRDCSVQRQHQKLVEEAPAPWLPPSALENLASQCAEAAAAMKYAGAGTFEFLYRDNAFYFIEMNTRLQVEHTVTEMVTGIDLVGLQLDLAFNRTGLPSQQDISLAGHAIECRVNAEFYNPDRKTFEPSPGLAYDVILPGGPGVRVDSHLYTGFQVSHHYDSLIAKIVCWGADRNEALARARGAMSEFRVRGIETNAGVLGAVLRSNQFAEGALNTGLLASIGVVK
ncbi:MAG: acetyl/propionyl/methylcrotonyl-CoA carboxylase subunit alpha [Pseudomonadota bacterium]